MTLVNLIYIAINNSLRRALRSNETGLKYRMWKQTTNQLYPSKFQSEVSL